MGCPLVHEVLEAGAEFSQRLPRFGTRNLVMMKWYMRRCMIVIFSTLLAVLPVSGGCGKRADPRDNPDFNEQAIDPSTVRIEDMGGTKDESK